MAMDLVDGSAAGGGSGDIATHLWTFLDRLSPAMYNRLYASPASCLSIFRCACLRAFQPPSRAEHSVLTGQRHLPHLTTSSSLQAAPSQRSTHRARHVVVRRDRADTRCRPVDPREAKRRRREGRTQVSRACLPTRPLLAMALTSFPVGTDISNIRSPHCSDCTSSRLA